MARYPVVDADGHITEPMDMWGQYLDPGFRDRAPRLVQTKDGIDAIFFEGTVHVPAFGGMGMLAAGSAGQGLGPRAMYDRRYAECHPGGFDPKARLQVMDTEGIDAAVLFPTFSALMIALMPDEAFAVALARAYNNWLADFCRTSPERLHGVAQVPLIHVDASVREARRAVKDLGMKMIYLRPNPYVGRAWADPVYDPFWTCLQDLDVPLAFHEGTFPEAVPTAGADRFQNFFFHHVVSHPFEQQLACLSFVAGGVLERFPRLKVAFMEAGCGWLPYWLDRIDGHHEHIGWMVPELTMKPSEYFQRQCYISLDPDEKEVAHVAATIGADKLLFASDFPHYDAMFPGAVAAIKDRETLTPEAKRLILGENAVRLLGLRVAALTP